MASSYTDNTGIEKPGSGEQSGTWGTTTNTNFDIIDDALNGVISIALTGNKTITTNDGATGEGTHKVLVFTGSLSSGATITIDPSSAEKVYLVYNTAGQTLTFTQGSGGNASVLNGTFAWIYADGEGSTAKVTAAEFVPADGTITTAKIADNAVTAAKLANTAVFASGTTMLFQQTAAPTGWTKHTSHNDKALRVTSGTVGTGGSVAFETAFASQTPAGTISTSVSGTVANHTLTTSQIPSHTHSGNVDLRTNWESGTSSQSPVGTGDARYDGSGSSPSFTTNATGGGGAHNHGWSGSATSTFSGTAINLDVQFVDVIICTKD